jgi:hypothetical protein
MAVLRSKFLPSVFLAGIIRIGAATAVLFIPGKIMAEECPLTAPLTLKDSQSGIAGETGTVWTIAPDCSFTIARHIGPKVLEPYKQGHLTGEQQARLKEMLDRMERADLVKPRPTIPRVNPRRISLSYGGREAVLTLPPGGGDVSQLRALPEDEQAKAMLEVAAAMKGMLGS